MWAEHDRSIDETLAWFVNRRRHQVNPAALQVEIQALAADNARLRQALADYEFNYRSLKAWANRAEARINQLLQERG